MAKIITSTKYTFSYHLTLGQRVTFVDRDGSQKPLDVTHIWGENRTGKEIPPLVNLGKLDEDDVTSVPHKNAVPGDTGYYYMIGL